MEKLNIHQKLVEIKKNIKGFSKDTKSYGFDYVSGSQILRATKDKMDELGVLLIPKVDYDTLHWEKHEYTTKKGEQKMDFIITMKMTYTWVNAENPTDTIEIDWVCIGQQTDDIAKAVGTAMTYNERYFLLKFLGLPTDEDDADKKEPSQTVKANNSNYSYKLSDNQINRLYAIASKNGFDIEAVKNKILAKYNKDIKGLNKQEYDYICDSLQKKNTTEKGA